MDLNKSSEETGLFSFWKSSLRLPFLFSLTASFLGVILSCLATTNKNGHWGDISFIAFFVFEYLFFSLLCALGPQDKLALKILIGISKIHLIIMSPIMILGWLFGHLGGRYAEDYSQEFIMTLVFVVIPAYNLITARAVLRSQK